MKPLLILACLTLSSCESLNGLFPEGAVVAYVNSGIEVSGMQGSISAAGYSNKSAYVLYSNGQRETFKVTGGGYGGGKLVFYIQGGGRVTVDTKTGQVVTEMTGGEGK